LPFVLVETVMTKVNKLGKGIILMHDIQKHTGEALPTLLSRLKAGGYSRPVSSVVQTVGN
jgi:hypothetical protein